MARAADLTCPEAERAISRDLDGLLSRRERYRLGAHVRGCAECATFVELQRRRRRALRELRLVPVPLSLQVFPLSGV
jgi:anti-sigma factor RsiW